MLLGTAKKEGEKKSLLKDLLTISPRRINKTVRFKRVKERDRESNLFLLFLLSSIYTHTHTHITSELCFFSLSAFQFERAQLSAPFDRFFFLIFTVQYIEEDDDDDAVIEVIT